MRVAFGDKLCEKCKGRGEYSYEYDGGYYCETRTAGCYMCSGTGVLEDESHVDWVDINPPIFSVPVTRYAP